jgi:hypothetical protein
MAASLRVPSGLEQSAAWMIWLISGGGFRSTARGPRITRDTWRSGHRRGQETRAERERACFPPCGVVPAQRGTGRGGTESPAIKVLDTALSEWQRNRRPDLVQNSFSFFGPGFRLARG